MAFLFPLAYLILVGWAWSATFKHRFSESIAPAIMLHVIILLFTPKSREISTQNINTPRCRVSARTADHV